MTGPAWSISDQERAELLVAAAEQARASGANGEAPAIAEETLCRLADHLAGDRVLDGQARLRWVRRTAGNLAFSRARI